MRVSVVGGGSAAGAHRETTENLGRALAERGHVVVCSGPGGVMRAVCSGAKEAGGETISILLGTDLNAANEFVDTAVATGMGHGVNALDP